MPPLRASFEGLWIGTPNGLAAFLVLLACGAVPGLGLEGPRRPGVAAVVLIAVVAADVILSASRGAWLGVAMATAVTGVAWALSADRDWMRSQMRRFSSGRQRAIGIAVRGRRPWVAAASRNCRDPSAAERYERELRCAAP